MNRRAIIAAISAFALSAGAFAQSQNQTFQVAGVARKYILHAPAGLPANPPLVYVIHGFNMSGQQEVQLTRMNAVADREKFIVVYPDALPNSSNQQSWDMAGENDYKFLLAIIDTVDARHPIDRNRVYASGFSQGGFMSFQLGCRYADVFAAIAPVSGLLNQACSPKRPVPMKFTFGTNEGFAVSGFVESAVKWVDLNGCNTTPTVTRPYPAGNPNSVVTRLAYSGCRQGADVVVDSVKGGPHEWPMNTQTKINNSEEVWAFFKKYTLSGSTALPLPSPAGRARFLARYSDGIIRLEGVDGNSRVRILDHRGRVIAEAPAGQGRFGFQGRPSGVYQVLVDGAGTRAALKIAIP